MNKNNDIQKLAFIEPSGKNLKKIKEVIHQVLNLILDKVTDSDNHTPLPKIKGKKIKKFVVNDLPVSERLIFKEIKKIIKNSMNASNTNYLGHMDSLPTTMSIVGDIISSSLNNNMLSKETAPILTEIEKTVTKAFANKFKLGRNSKGVMLAGGSLSNLQAILIARNKYFNTYKKGFFNEKRKPYIFASEYCHTSIQKAAMILGLGLDSVISVPTNKNSQIVSSELERLIKKRNNKNSYPFCVIATAGTTITGSIDPLNEIHKIAKKYKMWMHTDAVYGGALILSNEYKNKLIGIEKSDSISFNPQKWLYITKTCSMLLLKNKKDLEKGAYIPLPYVQKKKKDFHLGELSVQGTRYPDVLKLWLSLKHLGALTYSKLIDDSYEKTQLLKSNMLKKNYLKIACEPSMNIICFRGEPDYIPRIDHDKWNCDLQKYLLKKHKIFFSISKYKGSKWLRAVILNPFFSMSNINNILKGIDDFFQKNNNLKKDYA